MPAVAIILELQVAAIMLVAVKLEAEQPLDPGNAQLSSWQAERHPLL
jgi:hypothetical protein